MSVVVQALPLYAHTKQNIHRDYASIIVSNPRTVAPLNLTRLEKAHVRRCVCKQLVVFVYNVRKREHNTFVS